MNVNIGNSEEPNSTLWVENIKILEKRKLYVTKENITHLEVDFGIKKCWKKIVIINKLDVPDKSWMDGIISHEKICKRAARLLEL